MAKETVQVLGLKELDKKVRELTAATGKNFLAPALRKAANVIRDQAKENAPVDTGALRDAIAVRRDSNPMAQGKNEIMYVKPLLTFKQYINSGSKKETPLRYWHIVEFGAGYGAKRRKGTRFMTKAYDSKKREAVKEFMESLGKSIIRETKKLERTGKI